MSDATLTYGLVFLGLCLAGHFFIRARLPDADPYLYPLAALLAAFGLVMIYRINAEFAREQAQWFVVGLVVFCGTIVFLRDHHALERYRYTIAAAGIALLVMPRLPGIGAPVNGAYLGVKLGPDLLSAGGVRQDRDHRLPGELPPRHGGRARAVALHAHERRAAGAAVRDPRGAGRAGGRWLLGLGTAGTVLLAVFTASLVAVLRERPSLKHFGPLLLVWGLAMLMLLFIRDLGSSLMFFGGFLALLYVATGRLSLVGVGATMFLGGATFFANSVSHVQERVDIWLDPFAEATWCREEGYQIAQSLYAQADGGLFGQGFGQALLQIPGGGPLLPAAHTDLIYAVITDELGLFGAAGLILVYLMFAARGFKTALVAGDGFSKLLAAGLTAVLALQVFVIVGGVTKTIPLTGRDAAVRVLRRQLDRGQHDAAGAAADRLRPRSQGPRRRCREGSFEPPDRAAVRAVDDPVRHC